MRRFDKLNPTKYWLPNIPLTLMPPSRGLPSNKFVMRVQPDMTKIELKNYVSQLYGVAVTKVNTMNYEGKVKHAPRRGKIYRTRRYKKAILTTDDTLRVDDFTTSASGGRESATSTSGAGSAGRRGSIIEGEVVSTKRR